jgi:hypothetical protein
LLKFSPEGTVLQGSKKRVQFGKGRAVCCLQLLDSANAVTEFALE